MRRTSLMIHTGAVDTECALLAGERVRRLSGPRMRDRSDATIPALTDGGPRRLGRELEQVVSRRNRSTHLRT